MTAQEPIAQLAHVLKRYRGRKQPALSDIHLALYPGELIALIGPNGAGKSTLLDTLGGFIRPTQGTVTLGLRGDAIGWCPQREILDWSLTVRQNILLPLELNPALDREHRNQELERVLTLLQISTYVDQVVETLSGGQLRRVQIARALAGSPQLLLLDEPTTGLDPEGIRRLFQHLAERRQRGTTAVVSTHETSRLSQYVTRVIAISDGQVLADMPVTEFMSAAPESTDLWEAYTTIRNEART